MPSALSVQPSQEFQGNDGSWSTFKVNIGVGVQQQPLYLLPATSQSFVAPVLDAACSPTVSNLTNCATLRGGTFNPATDKVTWQPQTASDGSPYFALPFASEQPLGIFNNSNSSPIGAVAGFDNVVIEWDATNGSATLQNQVVAAYEDTRPFLGFLGLNAIPTHLFNATTSEPSPLQSLKTNGVIPSLYWGYTGGAYYKSPQAYGSLTFGGYDSARIDLTNALTVTMDGTTQDLSVYVNHISVNGQLITGLGAGALALVDSLVPEIWLPTAACQGFESLLGLTWNSTYNYYLISDTQYSKLQNLNPTFEFRIGSMYNAMNTVPITFNYSAFDQQLSFPLAGIKDSTTKLRYFPLRRSPTSQAFLGRTFLQEAYVIADYEKQNLTVGQALFPSSSRQISLVTVDYSTRSNPGLSGGAIAGIVIGALAGAALIAGLLFFFWRRRRQHFKQQAQSNYVPSSMGDTVTIAAPYSEVDMDESAGKAHQMAEYFKPGPIFPPPEEEQNAFHKPELDGTSVPGFVRVPPPAPTHYELDAGNDRPGHASQLSFGSVGSAVSPVSNGTRPRGSMVIEEGGQSPDLTSAAPSPPLFGSERHLSTETVPPLRVHEMQ